MTKLSIKLQQRGQDIQGRIELPADNLFTLECLHLIVEQLAQKVGMTPDQVMQDLYIIVMGHITKKVESKP